MDNLDWKHEMEKMRKLAEEYGLVEGVKVAQPSSNWMFWLGLFSLWNR